MKTSSLSRREKLLLTLLTSTLIFSASFSYGAVSQTKVDSIMKMITDGGAKFSDIPVSGQSKSERTQYFEKVDAGLGDAVEMLATVRNNIRSLMGLSPAYTADDIVGSILGGVVGGVGGGGGTTGGGGTGAGTETTGGSVSTLAWSLPSLPVTCPTNLEALRAMSPNTVTDVNPKGLHYYKARFGREFYANVLDHTDLPNAESNLYSTSVPNFKKPSHLPDTCTLGQKWVNFANESSGVCTIHTCEPVTITKNPVPNTGSIATSQSACQTLDSRYGFYVPEILDIDFRVGKTSGVRFLYNANPYSSFDSDPRSGTYPGSPNYAIKMTAGEYMLKPGSFGANGSFKGDRSFVSLFALNNAHAGYRNALAAEEQEFSISKCKGEFDPTKSLVGDFMLSFGDSPDPHFYTNRQDMIDAVNVYLMKRYTGSDVPQTALKSGNGFVQYPIQICPKNGAFVHDNGTLSNEGLCKYELIRIPYPITLDNYTSLDKRLLKIADVGDKIQFKGEGNQSTFVYINAKQGESWYVNVSPKKNIAERYKELAIGYKGSEVIDTTAGPNILINFSHTSVDSDVKDEGKRGKDEMFPGEPTRKNTGIIQDLRCGSKCAKK